MRSINASHLDVAIAAELRALTDARYADLESPKQISKKKPPPEVRKPPSEVQKPKPKPKPKMSERMANSCGPRPEGQGDRGLCDGQPGQQDRLRPGPGRGSGTITTIDASDVIAVNRLAR
jgi:hypothetical protein